MKRRCKPASDGKEEKESKNKQTIKIQMHIYLHSKCNDCLSYFFKMLHRHSHKQNPQNEKNVLTPKEIRLAEHSSRFRDSCEIEKPERERKTNQAAKNKNILQIHITH